MQQFMTVAQKLILPSPSPVTPLVLRRRFPAPPRGTCICAYVVVACICEAIGDFYAMKLARGNSMSLKVMLLCDCLLY